MTAHGPITQEPYQARGQAPVSWADAWKSLTRAGTYWLATVRAHGAHDQPPALPHLVPLLAVGVHGTLYFAAGPTTRKSRNLATYPHCAVASHVDGLDLVVEGEAARVRDEPLLGDVAGEYAAKYGWRVSVRGGAFQDAEGAPTAGPPPYEVYELRPRTAFGFPTDETSTPTRWRFS